MTSFIIKRIWPHGKTALFSIVTFRLPFNYNQILCEIIIITSTCLYTKYAYRIGIGNIEGVAVAVFICNNKSFQTCPVVRSFIQVSLLIQLLHFVDFTLWSNFYYEFYNFSKKYFQLQNQFTIFFCIFL